jgi:hypothetical protein
MDDFLRVGRSYFAADLVLAEGGGLAEFVATRGSLLPDDEALLASQWALISRSLYRVERAASDQLQLRDVRTGEQLAVELTFRASHPPRAGELVVGRPLPVGDTFRSFSGFIGVPISQRDAMLAALDTGDLDTIAAAVGDLYAPPRLSNTEGHDMVWHTLRWALDDADASAAALDASDLVRDDEGWRLERDTPSMPAAVIATLRLEGSALVGEVNSNERAEELTDVVGRLVPAATLTDDVVITVDDMPARIGTRGETQSHDIDLDDEEIKAALEEHIRRMEDRWLDESIPALGGRTPRDAISDPVGREDVMQLLDSFPEPGPDEFAFSPARLRAALGL